ncbi:MAG: ABC transporter ATP-binding protein [Chloroflexi bacterium]|nr:ABC transporter ATP-binding protein [Chloroflexota bacterium]
MPIIEAEGLVKKYKSLVAVAGVDFSVEEGECFGFLGPNGAGKTSIIRMISCVSPLTAGYLRVESKDVVIQGRAIRAIMGVVPQENNLDPDLSVLQNLLVYARYFDLTPAVARSRAEEILELFQLVDKKDERVDALSGGMKRRLVIGRALLNRPRILILDEPTTGLDPQARHLVWQKLRSLKEQGITMILSTHNMEEASHLCDRLVILHQGKVLAGGTPEALISYYVGAEALELHMEPGQKAAVLQELGKRPLMVEDVGDVLYVFSRDSEGLPRQLGVAVKKLVRRRATLEDVFLHLTGRGLQE